MNVGHVSNIETAAGTELVFVVLNVEGLAVNCVVDTGSMVTLVSEEIAKRSTK